MSRLKCKTYLSSYNQSSKTRAHNPWYSGESVRQTHQYTSKPTFLVIISPVRPGLTTPGIGVKVLDKPINILANLPF